MQSVYSRYTVQAGMDAPSEDAWTFDLTGLIHLPAALAPEQLAAAQLHSNPTEAAATLRAHSTLLELLPGLSISLCVSLCLSVSEPLRHAVLACGEIKYRLDQPPRLLPSGQRGAWLNSDAVEDAKRLGYDIVVGRPTGDYSFRRAAVRLTSAFSLATHFLIHI